MCHNSGIQSLISFLRRCNEYVLVASAQQEIKKKVKQQWQNHQYQIINNRTIGASVIIHLPSCILLRCTVAETFIHHPSYIVVPLLSLSLLSASSGLSRERERERKRERAWRSRAADEPIMVGSGCQANLNPAST